MQWNLIKVNEAYAGRRKFKPSPFINPADFIITYYVLHFAVIQESVIGLELYLFFIMIPFNLLKNDSISIIISYNNLITYKILFSPTQPSLYNCSYLWCNSCLFWKWRSTIPLSGFNSGFVYFPVVKHSMCVTIGL